jgi:hypothetical protein
MTPTHEKDRRQEEFPTAVRWTEDNSSSQQSEWNVDMEGYAPMKIPSRCEMIDADGHVVRGTKLEGKAELFRLLECWLRMSDMTTIGDIGNFGGRACIIIALGNGRTARLNSDTKRVAVEEFVKNAKASGADAPWSVVPNRRGRINKVSFRADGAATPGWYCFLTEPLSAPRKI